MDYANKKKQVKLMRDGQLLRLAATGTKKQLKAVKPNYRKTPAHLHLALSQRQQLVRELADCIGQLYDAVFCLGGRISPTWQRYCLDRCHRLNIRPLRLCSDSSIFWLIEEGP